MRTATAGTGSSTPVAAAVARMPCERRAQVALDVVVERLERRDVEHAQALAGLRHEAVEEPQERRQRLAGAGRGAQQRVLARRDRRPALGLRGRRRPERAREPAPRVRREAFERVDGDGGHRRRTIRRTGVIGSARPSAQQQVEREQAAGGHDHHGGERDAARDQAVARARRRARVRQQRAQRRGGQREAAERGRRVGIGGPDEQRRDGPDGDVLRRPRPQRAGPARMNAPMPPASGPVPAEAPRMPARTTSAIVMTSRRRMGRR